MNIPPKTKLFVLFALFFSLKVQLLKAQASNYSIVDNLNPVTPTAFQFTKYTDLPVSEYTGIPNISIPLYEISEDGVKVPLTLTYHSSGIKVNEEASWVGLGWDMTVGSIVQQINDQDDYAATTHLQSDFINPGEPNLFPFKYKWCAPPSGSGNLICNYGCNGFIEVPALSASEGIEIYTGDYAPFNGDYGYEKGQNYENYFSDHFTYSVDSEPDIFTANFCGHSFKFTVQWSSTNYPQIELLDAKGYQVTRLAGNTWKIIVPSGEEYDFGLEDAVTTSSYSQAVTGAVSLTPFPLPSSNIWMLTQIITKNKKVITFNYTQTGPQACYPTFTQKGALGTLQSSLYTGNTAVWASFCASSDITTRVPGPGAYTSTSSSTENYTYLSSISFPNGTINFNLSARNDINGGLKLDSLAISTTQQVKSYKFNYSYFDATAVGGNTYNFGTGFGNYPLYRLQLQSIQDNSGATHTFTYNTTQLPAKNSFATDYWGYYNGDISNSTLVPNAAQFNQTGWWVNSDNHSANLPYTQAGILTQIQYPTGGTVNFTYALNQFNTYWVPDYSNNTNTISSGDGLRVQSIVWKDAGGTQLKQTNYTYNGGMASIPVNFFRSYSYSTTPPGNLSSGASYYLQHLYQVNETNMSGSYTANPFASFNGVGYSQVIKTDVDNLGNTNGKIISNYFNQPDIVYNSITVIPQAAPTLPAYKNPADTADNGTLESEFYYNSSNTLLKKIVNTYQNVQSPLYYGARLMGYASLVQYVNDPSGGGYDQGLIPQSMIGYYPIYDFISLLNSSTETDYFGANSVASTTSYVYDSYNQVAVITKTNSTYNEATSFTYPYAYPSNTTLAAMTAVNRLSDIVSATKSTPKSVSVFSRTYRQAGNLYVANNDTTFTHLAYIPEVTTYDQYDPANGNILQYTKNTVPNSFIWDYNKEYVIAGVKNALYTNVAYTSFEADGTGNWTFAGTPTPDPAAPTGQKVYPLSSGNISCSGLDATLTYVVSYWSKNGAQTVSGSNATKTGYTINGYTYYESNVPTPSGGTITVSGTGTIDELRLYPNTAQMTSYTYAPLVGVTTESNAGGKIAYYEYDNAMRLLDIRDQNKNILKAFCYNYAGQPTTCGVNTVYSNAALFVPFTKACGSGYTGSVVNYTVAAGKYTSTMSQADANNQAMEEANANGQAYANANGICAQNISFALSNTSGNGYQATFYNTSFNLTFDFSTSPVTIPSGSYTVIVFPSGTSGNHTFTLGQRAPVTGVPRYTFYSVNIATGSTDSSLSITQ